MMCNGEETTKTTAVTSMRLAAKNCLSTNQNDLDLFSDGIIAPGDGTWMKRGFSSSFGVVTLYSKSA